MKIYLAGPMAGIPYLNYRTFDEVRDELTAGGHEVVSPADLDRDAGFDALELPETTNWNKPEEFVTDMRMVAMRCLIAVLECDAIYLMRGWEKSKGATAELGVARWMGLEVLYQTNATRLDDEPEEDVLEEALRITSDERQESYGPPDQDFRKTAAIWSVILGVKVEARDVALCMIAVKIARETHQRNRDNAVDIAGYARCLHLCNEAT